MAQDGAEGKSFTFDRVVGGGDRLLGEVERIPLQSGIDGGGGAVHHVKDVLAFGRGQPSQRALG